MKKESYEYLAESLYKKGYSKKRVEKALIKRYKAEGSDNERALKRAKFIAGYTSPLIKMANLIYILAQRQIVEIFVLEGKKGIAKRIKKLFPQKNIIQ